jgi:hypothetical protein
MQATAKSDDAPILYHFWDARILPQLQQPQRDKILTPIRGLALRRWKKNTRKGFLRWFRLSYSAEALHVNGSFHIQRIMQHKSASMDWIEGRD